MKYMKYSDGWTGPLDIKRELNTFSLVSPATFGFVHKVVPLSNVIYAGREGGAKAAAHVYKMESLVSSLTQKLNVKAGFHSLRSIFDQNILLKASRMNRKCAEEFSSGKKWVLKS